MSHGKDDPGNEEEHRRSWTSMRRKEKEIKDREVLADILIKVNIERMTGKQSGY